MLGVSINRHHSGDSGNVFEDVYLEVSVVLLEDRVRTEVELFKFFQVCLEIWQVFVKDDLEDVLCLFIVLSPEEIFFFDLYDIVQLF